MSVVMNYQAVPNKAQGHCYHCHQKLTEMLMEVAFT